ncbi:hypothetical protein DFH09DRAFT_1111148 [Mycena vulgaris]|nr:hypothetical protein DFH09DRAFT_1111148 [Mycena vulgaris]
MSQEKNGKTTVAWKCYDELYWFPRLNPVRTDNQVKLLLFAEKMAVARKLIAFSRASDLSNFWEVISGGLVYLLETSTDYERLTEDIATYRKTCLASKSGKVKPFLIALSDTSAAPADGRFKKDTQLAAPFEASEIQEHKLMVEIEKHHAFQEHLGKACYVTGSGEQYHYTNNDFVIWATLRRQNLATVDKVPDQLKIEDQIDHQRRAKKGLQVSQFTFNGGGPMPWAPMGPQMQMPPWMFMPPWLMGAPMNVPPPPPVPAAKTPSPAHVLNNVGSIQLDDLLDVRSANKLQELTGMN